MTFRGGRCCVIGHDAVVRRGGMDDCGGLSSRESGNGIGFLLLILGRGEDGGVN